MAETEKVTDVTLDYVDGEITVREDPVTVHVPKSEAGGENEPPVKIRWRVEDQTRIRDWRVILGTYAPVKSQVAKPGLNNDALTLVRNRAEDLGHWKYVVVALTPDGMKHKDPEMIVED
jgi:hypothetical protein